MTLLTLLMCECNDVSISMPYCVENNQPILPMMPFSLVTRAFFNDNILNQLYMYIAATKITIRLCGTVESPVMYLN